MRSNSRLPFIIALLCATAARAQQSPSALPPSPSQSTKYDVQAQYLSDFAKFVHWPAVTFDDSAFDLCLAGAPKGLITTLDQAATDEKVSDFPIKVRIVENLGDEKDCNELFIDSQFKATPALLAAVAGKPILTVSDAPGFLEHGGMMELVTQEGRVRFSVNMAPLTASGLTLNSELLKVALRVTGRTGAAQ